MKRGVARGWGAGMPKVDGGVGQKRDALNVVQIGLKMNAVACSNEVWDLVK